MKKGKIVFYLDQGPFLNDYPNSEDLHAQECTHMNDIAYIMWRLKKKKKKKKKDWPSQISGQKGKQTSFFQAFCILSYLHALPSQFTASLCNNTNKANLIFFSMAL